MGRKWSGVCVGEGGGAGGVCFSLETFLIIYGFHQPPTSCCISITSCFNSVK